MKLDDIMKLRPSEGADSATIATAIRAAEAALADQKRKGDGARRATADVLSPDRTLNAADREAAEADLAAMRIEAVLPAIRDDHGAALAREARAALLDQFEGLKTSAERLRRWQEDTYPEIARMIGEGLRIEDEVKAARASFLAAVDTAYATSHHQRENGPLGVTLPPMGAPMPRATFPEWQL